MLVGAFVKYSMKHIYFVRHGETTHNRAHRHQPATASLTELGHNQALRAASRIAPIEPDRLIASPLTRATQSARLIAQKTDLDVEPNILFAELKYPEHVIDRSHFGWSSLVYIVGWFLSIDESYWREVGGESRTGFRLRLKEAKHYLEQIPDDTTVVVVSHSVFINLLIALACNEKRIGAVRAALLLFKVKTLKNSSITHITHEPSRGDGSCAWQVVRSGQEGYVA